MVAGSKLASGQIVGSEQGTGLDVMGSIGDTDQGATGSGVLEGGQPVNLASILL